MPSARVSSKSTTTPSLRSSYQPFHRPPVQADGRDYRRHSPTPSSPTSPALSSASTIDAGPSPTLPALPAPRLPERVLALLRTPPASSDGASDADEDEDSHFVTASWGSPYPRSETSYLNPSSQSSETSEDSPIHQLELHTPFLRPAPFIVNSEGDDSISQSSLQYSLQLPSLSLPLHSGNPVSLVTAAILANRARRPARGLTEDWIRQHTTGDIGSESRLWLSDGSKGGSENSSLSGSVSGDTPLPSGDEENYLRTPRAGSSNRTLLQPEQTSYRQSRPSRDNRRYLRRRPSSIETLREADINRLNRLSPAPIHYDNMGSFQGTDAENAAVGTNGVNGVNGVNGINGVNSVKSAEAAAPAVPPKKPVTLPLSEKTAQTQESLNGKPSSNTSTRTTSKERSTTRRPKKKLPWKGKTIVVLLPIDEERGQPGHAPMPLSQETIENMQQSWKQLGYNIDGFDLNDADYDGPEGIDHPGRAMSRSPWPNEKDVEEERGLRKYPIVLPDLNAWKNYVEELNEAKLRALGVSFADEEPPLPPPPSTISPGIGASISRQSSAMYPPLPFSPPIPTSSASSNHAGSGFAFPAPFIPATFMGSSATQSPSLPSIASPVPMAMNPKYNARQSISIPAGAFQMPPHHHTPGGFSPQAMMLQQGLTRGGSPSLAALMSPTPPFTAEGFAVPPMHQRHQSLQFPLLQHQLQASARASPRLQDLQEVDEENINKNSRGPTSAPFIQHNASLSLQKEIDDAEYHLEEQFRSQFEHDRAYSPHGERQSTEALKSDVVEQSAAQNHARDLSVQFAPPPAIQRFRDDAENGPPLHHPRPHSRGHSLANGYYLEQEEARDNANLSGFAKVANLMPAPMHNGAQDGSRVDDAYEIQTNPSNVGTPTQPLDFGIALQQQQQQQQQQPPPPPPPPPPPHERDFSITANPWAEAAPFPSKPAVDKQRSSHGSKESLSRFNVEAPEFKFNPASASTFKSSFGSQFSFGTGASEPFQPIFHAGLPPNMGLPPNPSQFTFPAPSIVSTKINVNAPSFSPGQSEFNFAASGPKFRPDAPSFTPLHSFSNSLTSPVQSGGESISGGNRSSSIFGNIDINIADASKAAKRSKAVPIVRPTSQHSLPPNPTDKENEPQYDQEGRITDASRIKRAKATTKADDNDAVLFAEPITESNAKSDAADKSYEDQVEGDEATAAAQPASNEDEVNLAAEDVTLSSTIASESTDAKVPAPSSASDASPLQSNMPWTPFEFRSEADMLAFNSARPMEDVGFGHKKSLSATAKPFTPGASFFAFDAASDHIPVADIAIPSVEPADAEPVDKHTDEHVDEHVSGEQTLEKSVSPEKSPMPERLDTTQASSPPPPPPPRELAKPRGLAASRYASSTPPPPPPPKQSKPVGLASSRFMASSPSPPLVPAHDNEHAEDNFVVSPIKDAHETETSESVPPQEDMHAGREPTFEEIDHIMRRLADVDPAQGVNRTIDSPSWPQPRLVAAEGVHQTLVSGELEDPFVDPSPRRAANGHVSGASMSASEWEHDFMDEEQLKLESRVSFFDGRVNDVVGDLLSARLGPLEESLERIQDAVLSISDRNPLARRGRRNGSGDVQESDADDEDEEIPGTIARRSLSPRKDRRMEQMRAMFLDALAAHQQSLADSPAAVAVSAAEESVPEAAVATILEQLQDVKGQFEQALRLDSRDEDLRKIVEDALERRMPPTPPAASEAEGSGLNEEDESKTAALEARIAELEQQLAQGQTKIESEVALRRAADEQTADLRRKLEVADTKIEIEIMNRGIYDQHVTDLGERLKQQEGKAETEVERRREAEDRLSEVQRLLRIASEEETRLREVLGERDEKIKANDEANDNSRKHMAILEAALSNGEKMQGDLQNRLNAMERDLREKAQEARHWRSEAERAIDLSQRQGNDLLETATELKHVKKVVDTLGTQLQENERLREVWRGKFVALQEDMARAARDVAEESARYIRREQTLLARQDVLEAKLQAESRTRERFERELERLENGERQAMRAVSECKRLEGILEQMRTENHQLQQSALRYQAEFKEARDSAAHEVQRTRNSMQAEVDQANYQVNLVRSDLEDQLARVRGQLDHVKLEADTARARLEMLLEEAETTKRTALEEAETTRKRTVEGEKQRHTNEMEDLQARYERQIQNTTEDAQRAEQNLLERLSISTSKTEHLQDRVAHLEEKLEIAREAAQAAAKAANNKRALQPAVAVTATAAATAAQQGLGLPEKVSPQALRESIMVLQEQLQQREQCIEELESTLSKVDPDAEAKMAKRDDEIMWLRELLAVRHADLQDIVTALGRDDHDPERVRDAVIRLQANLQMEEQERERAMNGGSAITLPNIAASIRDAATPRVAQAVLPLAAAWGNWRKGRESNAGNTFGSLSGVLNHSSTPATPSRNSSVSSRAGSTSRAARTSSSSRPAANGNANGTSSFLSGLLTPPTSGTRQTPPSKQIRESRYSRDMTSRDQQPTAFASTGRRFAPDEAGSRRPSRSNSKLAVRRDSTPPPPDLHRAGRGQPVTPPMMHTSGYDSDAQAEEFDNAAFFDD